MSQWKDPLETPNLSFDEFLRLQNEIAHLQQENKVLHIQAQGVQVLGKVLQDSQENNAKLKQEVEQLKSHLVQKGIDAAHADLSVCTVDDDVLQSAVVEQGGSHHSSLAKSSTGIHDYVNVTTVPGPHSFSAGFPSLLPGDLHIKSIVVKTPQLQSGPETCEGCIQLQRQTTELQRQLLATKAEKDEALKLKEEILDVNHKWDAQYKMLVAATNKEISDLKHQVQVLSSPDRQTDRQFPEPMMERIRLQYQQPWTSQSPSKEQKPSHSSLLGAAALPTGAPAAAPTQEPHSRPGTTPYSQQISCEVIDRPD